MAPLSLTALGSCRLTICPRVVLGGADVPLVGNDSTENLVLCARLYLEKKFRRLFKEYTFKLVARKGSPIGAPCVPYSAV